MKRSRVTLFMGIVCGVVWSVCGLSSQAFAQGFAPAPQSVWLKLGYSTMRATQNFAGLNERVFDGDRVLGAKVPFRSRTGQIVGGEQHGHQATLDVVWSPLSRVVVGGFAPILSYLYYHNDTNNYTTSKLGVGDIQLFGGYQLSPPSARRVGVSAYGRLKIPTSNNFPYTNSAILSEAQVDVSGVLAMSFVLLSRLHLNATLEYRHRFDHESDAGKVELGDEVHTQLTLGGGPLDWVWFTAGYAGFMGKPWVVQPAGQEAGQTLLSRRFHAAMFGAYVDVGRYVQAPGLALDGWVKLPFAGRDHAVTTSAGVGVAYGF